MTAGNKLVRIDLGGHVKMLYRDTEYIGDPYVSSDGKHIAMVRLSGEVNVWLLEAP